MLKPMKISFDDKVYVHLNHYFRVISISNWIVLNIQKHRTHFSRIRQKSKIQNRKAKAFFLCIVWYTLIEKAGTREPEWTEAKRR